MAINQAGITESEAKASLSSINTTRKQARERIQIPWSLAIFMALFMATQMFSAVVNNSNVEKNEGLVALIGVSASALWIAGCVIWAIVLKKRGLKPKLAITNRAEKIIFSCAVILFLSMLPLGIFLLNSTNLVWMAFPVAATSFTFCVYLIHRFLLM